MEKQFKDNLKQIRESVGYTQKQVAQELCVSETCYAHWEQGRSEPNITTLKKLCKLFKVSIAELLCIDD